jgi:GT2 family glycosyltransferase
VVINDSSDDSEKVIRDTYPDVHLIVNEKKLGFTHNHNMVMREAKGKYILVLNDDTIILDNALEKMVDFMEGSPETGILGCKILNVDGSLQWSCGKSLSHKIEFVKSGMLRTLFPLIIKDKFYSRTTEVSWVTGACLMARAEAVRIVGLLDENFIIYFEDGDWCYRMTQKGWKVVFFPHAEIIHYYGQTRKKHLARDTFVVYQSRLYFFSKHYGNIACQIIRMLTMTEVALRYLRALVASRESKDEDRERLELISAYRQVLRFYLNGKRRDNQISS